MSGQVDESDTLAGPFLIPDSGGYSMILVLLGRRTKLDQAKGLVPM